MSADRLSGDLAKGDGEPVGRPPLDLRMLVPALMAWACTVVALPQPVNVVLGVAIGCLVLGVLCLLVGPGHRSSGWRAGIALGWLCTALLLGALAAHQSARTAGPVETLAAQRAIVRVTAVVESDPRLVVTNPARPTVIYRASVHAVVGRGARSTPDTPVLVFARPTWRAPAWHDRIEFMGRLQPADAGDDVAALLDARSPPRVVGRPGPLTRWVESLRSDTRAATASLPADPRGLVPALVTGDTARMSTRLNDDMRATGLTHLSAVSGSNVTFVLVGAGWLAGWCRVPRRWRTPLALLVLGWFVLLCRPEPSVLRAAVMGVVGLLGVSMSRRRVGSSALAAAIVVLLAWDPWLARSYGFALSALATLGLLVFARPWSDAMAARLPLRLRPVADAIAIPLAAQAACAPVIVLLQSSVSLVGVPANLLAAVFVEPATLAGVVTVLASPLGPAVAAVPAWCAAVPAWGIAWVAHVGARVPGGVLPWPSGLGGALLLGALTVLAIWGGVGLWRRARTHPALAAGCALALTAAAWPLPHLGWPPQGWVWISCDVGQGDGGVLATTPGHGVVVDTGPDPQHIDVCLQRAGVTRIDAIVLTHFHLDHVGGLTGALRGRSVGEIFVTPVVATSAPGTREAASNAPLVHRLAAARHIPVRTLVTGDTVNWPGVYAVVLWPSREIDAGSIQNNASITLDVRTHGLRILLTGDIEREAGAAVYGELSHQPTGPPFDVLKVAHHGSANQSADLVRFVHAPISIISVGAHNDYGLPTPSTLSLLKSLPGATYRTDRGGDVVVAVRDGRVTVDRP
ncbi:ComEC/Rec2 family competence protein [Allobranchiibius sp. GilTou38]|uniref:ComEC/Rec2 family competence protein n=1 Tax=Allobranchiibius sp. GilTou38 TaxID=2815210 RepID=UPI001AA1A3AA|nr:ComEC/Rec2 family competence protein [Allobranchiibius sp. GilTou38]MBO1765205.1 ComEC/Rec2 family competence protein [Allobranchiibius sp. GilTou38]